MAMNPMQKKARLSFILGMFLTLIITGIIIAYLIMQLGKMKKAEAEKQYKQVYVVSKTITSGEDITGATAVKTVEATAVPSNAITSVDAATYLTENAKAKINLEMGTVLTADMVNPEGELDSSDVRMQEYNMIILPSKLEAGETIDIRLRLPSGEDYIVLSKKYIEDTNAETIWVKVREDEILTMSNAIVEAYIMEGALLYATTYVDAGIQGATIPTYVVSNNVINLMNSDPNITKEAKEALSKRYTEAIRAQRDVINQTKNNYADNALTNVQGKLQEEIQKTQSARQTYIDSLGI